MKVYFLNFEGTMVVGFIGDGGAGVVVLLVRVINELCLHGAREPEAKPKVIKRKQRRRR
jgi:hypothetical protein